MVRAGYKQTEVGVIPEDWTVYELKDVLKIRHGKNQACILRKDGIYPILATSGEIGRTNIALYSKPSVLIGRKGTIDKPQYKEKPFWTVDTLFYSEISNGFYPKFIFYKFCLIDWRSYNEASGVPSLNAKTIEAIKVSSPKGKKEQTAIATALSDVDALITALSELIDKKRQIKTATMQQLLTGKQRLAGFGEGKGMKQTELMEIPEDWEVKRLGLLLKIRHGKSQHQVQKLNGNYPILATGGEIGRTDIPLYTKPSVLIGRKGTINNPQFRSEPFWTVDTLFYTEIASNISAKFIYYKFCMIDWMSYNEASGVPSLNAKTIEAIEISKPINSAEQQSIAQVLSDMDDELNALENRRAKAQALKQGMMQELLTGRTRLV